jgi:hypothetical protein
MSRILDFTGFLLEEEDKDPGKKISPEDIEYIKQNSRIVTKFFHYFMPSYAFRRGIYHSIIGLDKEEINSIYNSLKKSSKFSPEEIKEDSKDFFGFKVVAQLTNLEKFLTYLNSVGYHVIPKDFYSPYSRAFQCYLDFNFVIDENIPEGDMNFDFLEEDSERISSIIEINPTGKKDLLKFIEMAAEKETELISEESRAIGNLRLIDLDKSAVTKTGLDYKAQKISKEINIKIKKKIVETYNEIIKRSLDESDYTDKDIDKTIGDYLLRIFIEDPSKIIPLNNMNLDIAEEILDSGVISELPPKKQFGENDPFKEIRSKNILKNIPDL